MGTYGIGEGKRVGLGQAALGQPGPVGSDTGHLWFFLFPNVCPSGRSHDRSVRHLSWTSIFT